jgi:hypothetical protein
LLVTQQALQWGLKMEHSLVVMMAVTLVVMMVAMWVVKMVEKLESP